MSYVFSVSSLMKAGEVRKLCAEMRMNRSQLLLTEIQIKSQLFAKEKAASARTLTA
jgi:hypothetical protein